MALTQLDVHVRRDRERRLVVVHAIGRGEGIHEMSVPGKTHHLHLLLEVGRCHGVRVRVGHHLKKVVVK